MKSWDVGENHFKTREFWADEPISWEEISDSSGRTTLICTSRKIFSNDFLLAQKFLWRGDGEEWRVFLESLFQERHALGFDKSNLSVYKGEGKYVEEIMEKKLKISRVTIEFAPNGFIVERYAYNPYGANLEDKKVVLTKGEVIQEFVSAVARNEQIEAEKMVEE